MPGVEQAVLVAGDGQEGTGDLFYPGEVEHRAAGDAAVRAVRLRVAGVAAWAACPDGVERGPMEGRGAPFTNREIAVPDERTAALCEPYERQTAQLDAIAARYRRLKVTLEPDSQARNTNSPTPWGAGGGRAAGILAAWKTREDGTG